MLESIKKSVEEFETAREAVRREAVASRKVWALARATRNEAQGLDDEVARLRRVVEADPEPDELREELLRREAEEAGVTLALARALADEGVLDLDALVEKEVMRLVAETGEAEKGLERALTRRDEAWKKYTRVLTEARKAREELQGRIREAKALLSPQVRGYLRVVARQQQVEAEAQAQTESSTPEEEMAEALRAWDAAIRERRRKEREERARRLWWARARKEAREARKAAKVGKDSPVFVGDDGAALVVAPAKGVLDDPTRFGVLVGWYDDIADQEVGILFVPANRGGYGPHVHDRPVWIEGRKPSWVRRWVTRMEDAGVLVVPQYSGEDEREAVWSVVNNIQAAKEHAASRRREKMERAREVRNRVRIKK